MPKILGLTSIYDTKSQSWAIDLALDGTPGSTRFTVGSAEDVEAFLENFEESTAAQFDPASGEVSFSFEYAFEDEDEDVEEDEEEDEDDEDEDEEEDEETGVKEGEAAYATRRRKSS